MKTDVLKYPGIKLKGLVGKNVKLVSVWVLVSVNKS